MKVSTFIFVERGTSLDLACLGTEYNLGTSITSMASDDGGQAVGTIRGQFGVVEDRSQGNLVHKNLTYFNIINRNNMSSNSIIVLHFKFVTDILVLAMV